MIRELSFWVLAVADGGVIGLSLLTSLVYLAAIVATRKGWKALFIKSFTTTDWALFVIYSWIFVALIAFQRSVGESVWTIAQKGNLFISLVALVYMLFGGLPRALRKFGTAQAMNARIAEAMRAVFGEVAERKGRPMLHEGFALKVHDLMKQHGCDVGTAMALILPPEASAADRAFLAKMTARS
ncbi:hypothetical protein SAMN05216466_106142 [Paraburkholderia phenazinium]|uniref:Uncharacterized protein n=2 Tax=Paraburkholderia phenazinium TaxID=60549 RepID=A0A1G7YD83_9BURK|nr:hypothetical protein SAMN05216466_106142 [Paraburkholderia phenazinium]